MESLLVMHQTLWVHRFFSLRDGVSCVILYGIRAFGKDLTPALAVSTKTVPEQKHFPHTRAAAR